jgi:hypothetical protein
MKLIYVAVFCLFATVFSLGGCATAKTQAKVDWTAIVECAQINPANVAIQVAAISCIASIAAGSEANCLQDFAPTASWSLNEVACVAARTGGK